MSTIGEKKNALRARTMQRYYLQLVKNGFAALWVDWRTRALLVLATFSTFMLGLFISAQHTILWPLYLFDCLAGYTLLLCAAFILTSRIPNASRIIDNLLRIGIVNYAYEVPLPIQYTKRENNICEGSFYHARPQRQQYSLPSLPHWRPVPPVTSCISYNYPAICTDVICFVYSYYRYFFRKKVLTSRANCR